MSDRHDYFEEIDDEDDNEMEINDAYEKVRQSMEDSYEEHRHELYDDLPGKKSYYNYEGLNILTTTPLEEINPFQIKEIHVCPYTVSTNGLYPFVEYILVKNKIVHEEEDELVEEKELNFLHFPFFIGINVMTTCKQMLQIIRKGELTANYKGYLLENGNLYVFFDVSIEKQGRAIYKDNYSGIHSCLIDEIINNSFIQDIPIGTMTKEFFLDHLDLVFLKDIDGVKIEIPTVVYTGTTTKKMEFVSVFGHSPSDSDAILGPHYYFTSYKNAIKQSEEALIQYKNGEYVNKDNKSAVVRFAVFLGKLNVPTTLPLNEEEKEWMKKYDSVYLGKTEKLNEPIWVLSKYEQQTPLSYNRI